MKILTILSLLLVASAAYGELTKEDIRTIFKEEKCGVRKAHKRIYRSQN